MFRHTFKIRKDKSSDPVTFMTAMPNQVDTIDPSPEGVVITWSVPEYALVEARFGTIQRMMDRANSQWTVDVAVGTRKRLPDKAAATQYAENYCDDGKKDSFTPRKIDAEKAQEEAGFSTEQIAWLRSQGHIA